MKKVITSILIFSLFFLTSCAVNKTESPDIDTSPNDISNVTTERIPPIQTETETSFLNTTPIETNKESHIYDDTTTLQNDPAIGGTNYCRVHEGSYHDLSDWLNKLRDTAEVSEWLKTLKTDKSKLGSETECPFEYNIKLFIDEFDITQEEFADAYDMTQYGILDIDFLFSGTDEEIDAYYRDFERFDIESYRVGHYQSLYGEIHVAYRDEIIALQAGDEIPSAIPVPKLIVLLDIDREEVERYIDNATKKCLDTHGVCYTFDYNLDMIYGTGEVQAGDVSLKPLADLLSANEDDDPTNDISSNELDEMFCRVGRYAE